MPDPQNPKVVLVTGSSSGFGLLIAARLSPQHIVYASLRNPNKKQDLLAEVERRGGKVHVLPLDVTDHASIRSAVNGIEHEQGRIDVLVNNAGYGVGGFFEDLSDQDIRKQMEVNFFGVQNVTRVVIPIMRKQGKGKIINLSSVSGFQANACFGAYSASKWALEAFSESLHYELKLFGLDVHLVEPGTYRTRIFHENARYAENFDNPLSPYYPISQFLRRRVMDYVENCRKDPETIARLVERIIERPGAPFRNIPDLEGKMLFALRRILPFRFYSWIVRKALFTGLQEARYPSPN